jgi:hypothetical protein
MSSLNQKLIVGPTSEPVTLAQAKSWCLIPSTNTLDDALITGLISAARKICEAKTHRVFFAQTWQVSLDYFPIWLPQDSPAPANLSDWLLGKQLIDKMSILLPKPRCTASNTFDGSGNFTGVTGVTVTYLSAAGVQTTIPVTSMWIDNVSEPARLMPLGGSWPIAQLYLPGSIQIQFTCGEWTQTTIPQDIVTAIQLMVSHWYNNRNAASPMSLTAIEFGVDALLADHRCDYYGWV